MDFAYKSRWLDGAVVQEGVIIASSSVDAVSKIRLRTPHAKILDISVSLESSIRAWLDGSSGRMSDQVAAQLAKYLAMTLESGRDVKGAVRSIQSLTTDKQTLKRLNSIYQDLDHSSLSTAIVKNGFPKETMIMLSNAEHTGKLTTVLRSISEMLKLRISLRRDLKKASFEPIFVTFVLIVFVSVLVFFLIPGYAKIVEGIPNIHLTKMNQEIFALDLLLVKHVGIVLAVLFTIVASAIIVLSRPAVLNAVVNGASRTIPVIRTLRLAIASYKFVVTMRTVTVAGVPPVKALEEMMTNSAGRESSVYRIMWKEMKDNSKSLAEAIRRTGAYLPYVADSIAMAAESGKLADELGELEANTQELIKENLDRIKAAIPIFMYVGMGIIITLAGLALYGPMFSIVTNFMANHG